MMQPKPISQMMQAGIILGERYLAKNKVQPVRMLPRVKTRPKDKCWGIWLKKHLSIPLSTKQHSDNV